QGERERGLRLRPAASARAEAAHLALLDRHVAYDVLAAEEAVRGEEHEARGAQGHVELDHALLRRVADEEVRGAAEHARDLLRLVGGLLEARDGGRAAGGAPEADVELGERLHR